MKIKNRPYSIQYRVIILALAVVLAACGEDYLGKKSDKSLVIPTTLADLQALLDNSEEVINIVPGLNTVASDEGFTTYSAWQGLYTPAERNAYLWADKLYEGEPCDDWNKPYQQIFYANVVLEGLDKINVTAANERPWKNLKGSALFIRGHALLQVAELFTAPYAENVAATTPGVPIRLTADVNPPVRRGTQEQTYAQVEADLTAALEYLPSTSQYKTRPTVAAALALLARVNLFRGRYEEAEKYASQALQQHNYLLDFNALEINANRPVPRMNDEILFHSVMVSYGYTIFSTTYVDTLLYTRYHPDDLRRIAFFRLRQPNRYSFKANYTGSGTMFGGIANDEVFLIRAESRARLGNVAGALEDLNTLLAKRWKADAFIPHTETDADVLLALILDERQKELLFRGLRWSDLRRLNKDPRFAKTLRRTLQGVEYVLSPNDERYVFPIPEQEIQTSGIEQNPR